MGKPIRREKEPEVVQEGAREVGGFMGRTSDFEVEALVEVRYCGFFRR